MLKLYWNKERSDIPEKIAIITWSVVTLRSVPCALVTLLHVLLRSVVIRVLITLVCCVLDFLSPSTALVFDTILQRYGNSIC